MTSSQISHDVNDKCLENCDKTQVQLMKEECILVNENDQQTGSASKKQCHLLENRQKGIFFLAELQ
jgi:isopentenyl-diphosphate delta-isomerase